MTPSRAVVWLSAVVAALASIAAGAGLFWPGGDGSFEVTSVRGETVQLYGRGLYRHDTLFVGALNRGTDAAVLLVAVPLLLVAVAWYRRGSLRGSLLLAGALAYFLYVYASAALGATAYNGLFLAYVALFSASLFALVLLLASIDPAGLAARLSPRAPGRGLAVFMLACGSVTTAVWLGMGLLPAMLGGEPPEHLDTYSTSVTDALDLGIITPATLLVGILLLRRAPLGYVLAVPLLGILVLLAPSVVAQTISQSLAGVSFSPGEIAGPIAGFGLLAVLAIWLLAALLRSVAEAGPGHRVTTDADERERGVPGSPGGPPRGTRLPASSS
jgi:hypothetical protein